MLTHVLIENFQAAEEVDIELGKLTVITGPTNAGKSAVIRALRLLAENARGSSFIRHGQKTCRVSLVDDSGLGVAIARGKGQDAYVLDVLGEQKTFTKLGGQVPDEVAELLALGELNFAGQLDRPFLLDESGGAVARILGRLTNLDLVFEAAREASRRRAGVTRDLARAEREIESLAAEVTQYAALPVQRASVGEAEVALGHARHLQERALKLTRLVQEATVARHAYSAANAVLTLLEPPSLAKAEELASRGTRLRELFCELADSEDDVATQGDYQGQLAGQEGLKHRAIHDLLAEAGQCPTCGLPVPRK